jgi:hypothetical protein
MDVLSKGVWTRMVMESQNCDIQEKIYFVEGLSSTTKNGRPMVIP